MDHITSISLNKNEIFSLYFIINGDKFDWKANAPSTQYFNSKNEDQKAKSRNCLRAVEINSLKIYKPTIEARNIQFPVELLSIRLWNFNAFKIMCPGGAIFYFFHSFFHFFTLFSNHRRTVKMVIDFNYFQKIILYGNVWLSKCL